jgi:membrane-associated phospholipid phosphatase
MTSLRPFAVGADREGENEKFYGFLSRKQFYVGGAALIGTVALLDEETRDRLFPYSNIDPSRDLKRLGDTGQASGLAFGALFGIHGVLFNNAKSRETAGLSFEAFVISGLAASAIKMAVGRQRPLSTVNPTSFGHSGLNSSFPSGHTTVAFAAATVVAEQYPRWYIAAPLYAGAAGVGFSRMYANKHWMSDVVAGAMLGTATAHELRKFHKRRKKMSSWMLVPTFNGIQFVKAFGGPPENALSK